MGFADERPAMSFPRQSYSGLGGPLWTSDSARGLRYPVHLTVRLSLHWSLSVMTVAAVERYGPLEEAVTGGLTWVSLFGPAMSCL